MDNKKYIVSPSPHIHADISTTSVMRDVIIALSPAAVVAILVYGWAELLVLLVSIVSCVLLEWAVTRWMMKRPSTVGDLSAVVTGLLLALNLPSAIPLWIVFIGAVVAICVAKLPFGGIGQNVFNPAITGRVFLLVSFPAQMTNWTPTPGFVPVPDAVSGATPLSLLKEALKGGSTIPQFLASNDFSMSSLLWDIGASAGELSAGALLIGFIYLLIRRVVKPWIPLSILGTMALISVVFHTVNPDIYTGPVFNIMTGGTLLGAFFMATDYVTSPMNVWGGVIFGVGIGLIDMMIRYFGAYPEGMSFAILLMNCTVPLLNRWFHQKKYGRT
ncbi:MAG: RnfABCDGE type electron transport complex subunit D [Bacteroidales bacterium]|nr:RnfABCDGE type electron transport complex subunit D [Bacteroidales bacterium]